jgi:hypothetical protein
MDMSLADVGDQHDSEVFVEPQRPGGSPTTADGFCAFFDKTSREQRR